MQTQAASDRPDGAARGSEIFCCPITGEDLSVLGDGAAAAIRAQIEAGALTHLDGSRARSDFDLFLKAATSNILYAARDGVFILLPAFALVDAAERGAHGGEITNADTLAVMSFYDRIGWTEAASGVFVDADINEDFRDVSSDYVKLCHLRVNDHLPQSGKYIVDVASGPIQYPEYLTYSENFDWRVCCDVSFEALRLARAKLGDRGLYVQCDITRLPFKTGSVDAVISLHTIYHVPADDQPKAFRELQRITRGGGRAVVVYSWGDHAWAMRVLAWLGRAIKAVVSLPGRAFRRLVRMVAPPPAAPAPGPSAHSGQQSASHFCYHAHTFDWFERNIASAGGWRVYSWRSLSVEFIQANLPDNGFGRAVLAAAFRLENRLPRLLGRIGQYPMLVFDKADPG